MAARSPRRPSSTCHRVLSKSLGDASRLELIARNVATLVSPPKVKAKEMEILSPDEVKAVLAAMRDTARSSPGRRASGDQRARRSKLMGLKWGDLDLDAGKLRIERSIEKTTGRLARQNAQDPAWQHLFTLPASCVAVMREHRKAAARIARRARRRALWDPDAFIFGTLEGRSARPRPHHPGLEAVRRDARSRAR